MKRPFLLFSVVLCGGCASSRRGGAAWGSNTIVSTVSAFRVQGTIPKRVRRQPPVVSASCLSPPPHTPVCNVVPLRKGHSSSSSLFAYNLPPGGGGGGNNKKNDDGGVVGQVLSGAVTIAALVLFFASPLGSVFFAITNSLLLLALLAPVALTVAFQVWRALNTIEGTCPNCGAARQTVLKDPDQLSLCLNCGTFLKASDDLKSIKLGAPVGPGGEDFIDLDQTTRTGGGIFDQLFGGGGGVSPQQDQSPRQPSPSSVMEKEKKFRREQTVIDVEVDDD